MKTVILLGFSTTGKSTLGELIAERIGESITTFDTDKFVSENYGKHIYNLFLQNTTVNGNSNSALELIKRKQIEAINVLKSHQDKNVLVSAGPFIVQMPNWNDYVYSLKNSKFIYLRKNAEEVYSGLMDRRRRLIEEGISIHPNFGCWDNYVTTFYDGKIYKLLPKEIAVKNIQQIMSGVIPEYKKLAKDNTYDSEILRTNADKQEVFIKEIISFLSK